MGPIHIWEKMTSLLAKLKELPSPKKSRAINFSLAKICVDFPKFASAAFDYPYLGTGHKVSAWGGRREFSKFPTEKFRSPPKSGQKISWPNHLIGKFFVAHPEISNHIDQRN